MVSLLNSQAMKSCKSRESFCLSILSIYTNDWSFFFIGPKYVQAKNRLAHLNWDFMTWFHLIRNFLANEIYQFSRLSHQTNCLFTGIALSIISSLSSHFFLFQNATLHKILKLGFWLLSAFFSECSFHWMQHFCLSFWLFV